MRKLSTLLLILFLASCTSSDNEVVDTTATLPSTRAVKSSTMSYKLINEMINNYRDNQLVAIESASPNAIKEDAQSIRFDIETLKAFIASVETNARNNGNTKNLGIRFYYAAYPEVNKWTTEGYEDLQELLDDPITQQYGNKHTLIMIPTMEQVNGRHVDFNPLDVNTYDNGIIVDAEDVSRYTKQTTSGAAQNHGSLIPPGNTSGGEN